MRRTIMDAINALPNKEAILEHLSDPNVSADDAVDYVEKHTGIRFSPSTFWSFFSDQKMPRKNNQTVIKRSLKQIKRLKAFSRFAGDEKYGLKELTVAFEELTGRKVCPKTMREFRYRCGIERIGTGQYQSLRYCLERKKVRKSTIAAIKDYSIKAEDVIEMIYKETGRRFSKSTISEHRRGRYDR